MADGSIATVSTDQRQRANNISAPKEQQNIVVIGKVVVTSLVGECFPNIVL